MSIEYTFSIIKPDATKRNLIGEIICFFENAELEIVAQKMLKLTVKQAQEFYAEHANRPFFADLVKYMTSGPVVLQVLKGENAVTKNRAIMGATNPQDAEVNTIRNKLGLNIEENSVHGSDSNISAEREIAFFFKKEEILK